MCANDSFRLRFDPLLESIQECVLLLDEGGNIRSANSYAEKALGYSLAEFKSLSYFTLDKEITPHLLGSLMKESIKLGSLTFETTLSTAQGEKIPKEMKLGQIDWEGIPYYLLFARQVRERQQLNAAISRSEHKFRSFFDSMNTGSILLEFEPEKPRGEIEFRFLDINRFMLDKFSTFFVHWEGQPIKPLIKEYPAVIEILKDIALDGKARRFFFSTNGPYMISCNATAFRVQEGQLGIILDDVTEQIRNERALKESEEKYHKIFSLESDGLFLGNWDSGQILEANLSAGKMFGYTMEEIIKQHIFDLSSKPENLKEKLKNRGLEIEEEMGRKKSGEFFPVQYSLSYFTLKEQPVFLAVVRDLSQQKLLEEELRQSEKLQAIGQLAGGIAHDFNNQLMGIMGYASLIIENSKEASVLRYANNIFHSSKRTADLTQKLLSFSRKGKVFSQDLDLHLLIKETLDILSPGIDNSYTITLNLNAANPNIYGDPSQLEGALINLALNARDAMPEGGEISITTELITLESEGDHRLNLAPGNYIKLSLADTGEGMKESVQKRIFEPFFTTKSVGKGTGLGLAAVFGTMESHGGTITFESTTGEGTTFFLYFPAIDRKPAPLIPSKRQKTVREEKTILLVDDEEIIRDITSELLKEMGYQVLSFADGESAVEFYRRQWREVDLLLVDMVMPKMNGREFFRRAREINPRAKAYYFSGYSLMGDGHTLEEDGVLGLISKPASQETLDQKLQAAFVSS